MASSASDVVRTALCDAGRRLGSRGLISASEGNLSIRLAGDRLLVTPAGLRKDELSNADLATVPLEPAAGAPAAGRRPSSDIAIHRAIYRARPEVVAIAHAHLPASMGLTLAGEAPDPAALPETAHFLPILPFVAFGAMGSEELAGRVATAFAPGERPLPVAVLLERHGAIAIGLDADREGSGREPGPSSADLARALEAAVNRLELVDVLCRAWRDAVLLRAALGRPGPIRPAGA